MGIGYIRGAIGVVRDGLLGEKLRSSTPGLLPVFKPEQLLFYFFCILVST